MKIRYGVDPKATEKVLLNEYPNAFRTVNTVLGVDFEKPYGIIHHSGKYTTKQIIKQAEKYGYNDTCILILLTREPSPYTRRDYCLVTVDELGRAAIDYKIPYSLGYPNIDTFYAKRQFESVRKSDLADTVIIWQDRKYTCAIQKEKPVDRSARFHLLDYGKIQDSTRQKSYIQWLRLQKTDEKGGEIRLDLIGMVFYPGSKYYAMEINDAIDKSGYLLQDRRNDLKRRAAALKAERQKSAFIASDNTDKITAIKNALVRRKAEILKEFERAKTVEELEIVEKSLSRWNGYIRAVSDFNTFKKRVEEKAFNSISDCERDYKTIMERLEVENND